MPVGSGAAGTLDSAQDGGGERDTPDGGRIRDPRPWCDMTVFTGTLIYHRWPTTFRQGVQTAATLQREALAGASRLGNYGGDLLRTYGTDILGGLSTLGGVVPRQIAPLPFPVPDDGDGPRLPAVA